MPGVRYFLDVFFSFSLPPHKEDIIVTLILRMRKMKAERLNKLLKVTLDLVSECARIWIQEPLKPWNFPCCHAQSQGRSLNLGQVLINLGSLSSVTSYGLETGQIRILSMGYVISILYGIFRNLGERKVMSFRMGVSFLIRFCGLKLQSEKVSKKLDTKGLICMGLICIECPEQANAQT